MSITRKFLKGMGLTEEQVDTIIEAHTETVDGLKRDVDKYKKDAEKLADVQKELNDLKAAGDGGLQQQLDDLQKKYNDDAATHKSAVEALQKQLADREYSDAITRAITSNGLKFSSKSAEKAFIADIRERNLELKDGKLQGLDDFVNAQKEADPDAFAPEKPHARFAGPVGIGGAPTQTKSRAAEIAAQYHANHYGTTKESDK